MFAIGSGKNTPIESIYLYDAFRPSETNQVLCFNSTHREGLIEIHSVFFVMTQTSPAFLSESCRQPAHNELFLMSFVRLTTFSSITFCCNFIETGRPNICAKNRLKNKQKHKKDGSKQALSPKIEMKKIKMKFSMPSERKNCEE